jgi:hypothetical protein
MSGVAGGRRYSRVVGFKPSLNRIELDIYRTAMTGRFLENSFPVSSSISLYSLLVFSTHYGEIHFPIYVFHFGLREY